MAFTRKELTEWTDALRANPEQQTTKTLANATYTAFCCLGKLCEVQKIPRNGNGTYAFDRGRIHDLLLEGTLKEKFGSHNGDFRDLHMPPLNGFIAASAANDAGVSWFDIADHFDLYYHCSDETETMEERLNYYRDLFEEDGCTEEEAFTAAWNTEMENKGKLFHVAGWWKGKYLSTHFVWEDSLEGYNYWNELNTYISERKAK